MENIVWLSLGCFVVGTLLLLVTSPDLPPNTISAIGIITNVQHGKVSKGMLQTRIPVVSFDKKLEEGSGMYTGRLQAYKGRVECVIV